MEASGNDSEAPFDRVCDTMLRSHDRVCDRVCDTMVGLPYDSEAPLYDRVTMIGFVIQFFCNYH